MVALVLWLAAIFAIYVTVSEWQHGQAGCAAVSLLALIVALAVSPDSVIFWLFSGGLIGLAAFLSRRAAGAGMPQAPSLPRFTRAVASAGSPRAFETEASQPVASSPTLTRQPSAVTCQACGADAAPTARFCGQCGDSPFRCLGLIGTP